MTPPALRIAFQGGSIALVLVNILSCARFKEENFAATAAEASCRTFRRCNPAGFYASYDTLDECVLQTQVGPTNASECVYDPALARDCIQALGWDCEKLGERNDEVDELCGAVWDCGGAPVDSSTEG